MTEYIEREAAFDAVFGQFCASSDETEAALNGAIADIRKIPAADVREAVRGKWIDRDDDYYGWNMWACSACGEEFVLTEGTPDMNDYHFCPNCGADMRPQPPKEE